MKTIAKHNPKHPGGSITAEFVVALAVMGLIFSLVISSFYEVGQANRSQWARQQCLRAAEAQLDSFTAFGRPISEADWHRLWPAIDYRVATAPGEGDWRGLIRVEITTQTYSEGRHIEVTASRYVSSLAEGD